MSERLSAWRWAALVVLALGAGACIPAGGGGGGGDDDEDGGVEVDGGDDDGGQDAFVDIDDGIPPPDMFVDPDDGIPPADGGPMFPDGTPADAADPPDGCVARDEVCDGADDDCDGAIDEDFAELGAPCTVGEGLCETEGVVICRPDGQGVVCGSEGGEPLGEVCNGLDDDCDGIADEEIADRPCETDVVGRCRMGTEVCIDGMALCLSDLEPRDERCDGIDDDCDGFTDEEIGGAACDAGQPGRCGEGVSACEAGALLCVGPEPVDEVCNTVDDDCDGTSDEGGVCDACEGVMCPPGTNCVDGECLPVDVGDALPIAAPGGQIRTNGSLDALDPVWTRPNDSCDGRRDNPGYHYQVHRVVNQTGAPRVIRVTTTWNGTDGFLHIFEDPFVDDLARCLAGSDDFNGTNQSQVAAQIIGDGEVLAIVASTFSAGVQIPAYEVLVETLVDPVPPEAVCDDGIDNDRDGFTDCDDFDCDDPDLCAGQQEFDCGNGIDDDRNGFTDCDDFACLGDPACEGPGGDECVDYVRLADAARNVAAGDGNNCDQVGRNTPVQFDRWHRFVPPAGTQMPTAPPPVDRCTTDATGWLNGAHPLERDGIVEREVCFNWSGVPCRWSAQVGVRNCGGFYVYRLPQVPVCSLVYCGQ